MKPTLRSLAYGLGARLAPEPSGVQLILVYHEISPAGETAVPPAVFRDQIGYLREVFEVVPVSELVDSRVQSSVNRAAISFDDGYRNQLENALPVLEEFGLRGTFYLCPDRLGGTISTSSGDRPVMGRAPVRELARAGHEIGSHGLSHESLVDCGAREVLEEVRSSRDRLGELVEAPVNSFAYPWGRHDEAVRSAVAEAGYENAVTTREAFCRPSGDPYRLPRIGVDRRIGRAALRVKTSPWLPFVRRISRWLS